MEALTRFKLLKKILLTFQIKWREHFNENISRGEKLGSIEIWEKGIKERDYRTNLLQSSQCVLALLVVGHCSHLLQWEATLGTDLRREVSLSVPALSTTPQYHPSVPPLSTTPQYHPSVPPLCTGPQYHPSVPPLSTTCTRLYPSVIYYR